MEEYSDIENDTFDACDTSDAPDATPATTNGEEHEAKQQAQQVRQQLGVELERNRSGKLGVLRATSGNGAKRFKARQESRVTTRAGKSAEAVIKQFASEELQSEMEKMQGWKANVMQEVARELQVIRQAQEEAMEAQRQSFQAELERLKKMWEIKSKSLEDEIKLLQTSGQHPAQKKLAKKASTTSDNERVDKQVDKRVEQLDKEGESAEEGEVVPPQSQARNLHASIPNVGTKRLIIEKQSYAAVAASRPSQIPEHPWTQVKHKARKQSAQQSTTIGGEYQGRRILFPREISGHQTSEADLMLALNEVLQKAGEAIHTRFCRVRYSPSGAISALLTEKANAGVLIPRLSNVLIRAAKTVDPAVVGVEILEHWQRLKVHGMSLERYLGEGSMELLKREVESSTGIQLKALPRWLINKSRLREQQEAGKRGSAIVVTVKGEAEAKKLCASGLRFGGVVRVVEKYWEAGPSSVCMRCCGIGHERMGSCGDRPPKCVICAAPHKVEDHCCGVPGCNKGKGKICVHVTAKCANCGGAHAANSPRCGSRHKADIQARQSKRVIGKKEKTQVEGASESEIMGIEQSPEPERGEESPPADTDMDLEGGNWTQYAEREPPGIYDDESQNHTKNY